MARIKLTAGRVREFSCDPGKSQTFLWDSEAPGLGLRATASGVKAYIFQGKLDGSSLRITIGDAKSWDIETGSYERPGAREEARRLQGMIDRGIDPRAAKADLLERNHLQRLEAARKDVTLEDAWAAYVHARKHTWSERYLRDHQEIIDRGGKPVKRGKKGQIKEPDALAGLLDDKLSEIRKVRISEWLRNEAIRRPTRAALAFRMLRAFLNWCEETPEYSGLAEPGACSGRVSRESLPKLKPKRDCLQREQLPGWFAAVQGLSSPVVSAYLQVLLLTGARREELAGLKWEDVDFKWKSINIRDKVEGERTIPLTPYVSSLLSELKLLNDRPFSVSVMGSDQTFKTVPSKWVFSSPTAVSGRLQDPSHAHRKACANAAIAHLTLHGLRRSFKSLAEWLEMPVGVVAQIMGHKPSAIAEKHYTVRPLDLLRIWHSKYEAWLLKEGKVQFDHGPKEGKKLKAVS